MKNSLSILYIAFCLNVTGQNIVPNYSFENYDSLPCSIITTSTDFSNFIQDWFVPTQGTCDIFSSIVSDTCITHSNSPIVGAIGSQTPRTGNVMAGFISMDNVPPLANPYREYLSVKLNSPLEVGEVYEAYAYISLTNYSRYATNNIGMYFSISSISNPNTYGVLSFTPQVNETSVITDTAKWVKIGGRFKANSAAQYLTIGNFLNDNSTKKISRPIFSFPFFHPIPYYLIDDIMVQKFSLRISKDTTLCPGDSVELVTNTDSIIGWADKTNPNIILSTTPTLKVSPSTKTTYIAYTPWDTGQVVVDVLSELSLDLGADTTICLGESLTINASTSNAEYRWQDGSTDSIFKAIETRKYWVKVRHSCGIFYDTISVNFIDCEIKVEMPNVFTPNNDRTNDYFYPTKIENGIYGKLVVFNRWGYMMYEGPLRSKGWDGTCHGQPCTEGVYYWIVTYVDQTGNTKTAKGYVTLAK